MMPIAAISGKAGRLNAKDRANFSCADFGNQSLKARAFDQAGAGASKILVDHSNITEAQLARSIRQVILAALALLVVHHLSNGRLPDVNHGASTKVLISQFRIHCFLRLLDCFRFPALRRRASPRVRGPVLVVCRREESLLERLGAAG
jgi:hypothetical protein